jgi:antirestriction protein ArdC
VEYARTASYSPAFDTITMAAPHFHVSAEEYAAAKFHEIAHSTAKSTRLNRQYDKASSNRSNYSREELVCEMTASMLCGVVGILDRTIDNSAAYLQGWISVLKTDKRAVVVAAGAAQKATDWILDSHADQQAKPQPMALAA